MALLRSLLAYSIVLLALVLTTSGCKKPEESASAPPSNLAPPDSMLCEGTVRAPDLTWKNMQQGVAGLATLLPSSAFGVLAVSGGLEVTLGDLVDGSRPATFVLAGNVLTPEWVLVTSARERRAVEAKYPSRGAPRLVAPSTISLERLPISGTLGDPKAGNAPFTVYLSSRGDLVIARDEASADLLAPYALFGTKLQEATPGPGGHDAVLRIPESAMPALANVLRLKWTQIELKLVEQDAADRRAHGGRAPDFGDPAALVAAANAMVTQTTEYLGDSGDVRITFDASKEGTTLEMQIPSKGGAWTKLLTGLVEGSGEPLAAEPMSTRIAWLGYGTAAVRAEHGKMVAGVLGEILKDRVSAPTKDALTRALTGFGTQAGPAIRVRLESEPLRAMVSTTPSATAPYQQSVQDGVAVFQREAKLREFLRISKIEGPTKMKPGQGNTDSNVPLRTLFTSTDGALALYQREKAGQVALVLERAPKLDLLTDLPGDAPWLQTVRPELSRMLTELGPRSMFLVLSGVAMSKTAEEPSVLVMGAGRREAPVAGGKTAQVVSLRMVAPYRFARELPRLAVPSILSP